MFEGNQRVITALSGGVIESLGLSGHQRDHLISNLDWTPTLLQFAGYLNDIAASDITWDGVSQYDMIVHNTKVRNHLVLNIGDSELRSASILVEDDVADGNLYKYIVSTPGCIADRWIYSPSKRHVDSWSIVDIIDGQSVRGFKLQDDEQEPFSKIIDNSYLFDLTNDQSEMYNLLNNRLPNFNERRNNRIIAKCHNILSKWVDVEVNELFSSPLNFFHDRLEQGEPINLMDGKFVRPFLSDDEYERIINQMFDDDITKGNFHSDAQRNLYLHRWQCPKNKNKKSFQSIIATNNRHNHMQNFVLSSDNSIMSQFEMKTRLCLMRISVFIFVGIALFLLYWKGKQVEESTSSFSSQYSTF